MTPEKALLLVFSSFLFLIGGGVCLASLQIPEPWLGNAMLALLGVWALLYLAGVAVWAVAKGHHVLWGILPNVIGPIVVGMIATRFDSNFAIWSVLIMPLPGLLMVLLLPNANADSPKVAEKNSGPGGEWELKNLAKRVALLEQMTQSPAAAALARQRIEMTGSTIAEYHSRTLTLLKNFCDATPSEKFKPMAETLLVQIRSIELPVGTT